MADTSITECLTEEGAGSQAFRVYMDLLRLFRYSMAKEPKSMFAPDKTVDARLDAEAMAAYRAGRVVPHAKVAEWLDSWGKEDELPCPKPEGR